MATATASHPIQHGDVEKRFKIVVGIDFGTSGVAAGYILLPVKDMATMEIHSINSLPGITDRDKAPTCIALHRDPPHEILAFSSDVVQLLRREDSDALVFHRFKMQLYDANRKEKDLLSLRIPADVGKGDLPLILVITRCLEFVCEKVKKEIHTRGLRLKPSEYKWVLTVPAIWSEQAKACMRIAAVNAGIIKEEASDQLTLALEPECAALDSYYSILSEVANTKHMVIDAGGGTVDVAVHHVQSVEDPKASGKTYQIEEVYKASGRPIYYYINLKKRNKDGS